MVINWHFIFKTFTLLTEMENNIVLRMIILYRADHNIIYLSKSGCFLRLLTNFLTITKSYLRTKFKNICVYLYILSFTLVILFERNWHRILITYKWFRIYIFSTQEMRCSKALSSVHVLIHVWWVLIGLIMRDNPYYVWISIDSDDRVKLV